MLPAKGTFKSLTCVRKVTLADPLRYFKVMVVPLDIRKGFRTMAGRVELGEWDGGTHSQVGGSRYDQITARQNPEAGRATDEVDHYREIDQVGGEGQCEHRQRERHR